MVYLLLICLALSALLALNAFASLVATVLWRLSKRIAHRWPARLRAQLIFTLRVFPLVGAIIGVAALILPSYLAYEPRPPDEEVTLKLTVITMLSLAGLGLACWRGFVSWFATRRLESDWMLHAEAIWIEGVSVPAYRIRHLFPVMAVVGVLRPRLFIAGQVFDSLSDDEIKAAIRHELGHMANRDNLKRVLMRACRDLLLLAPDGRSLEQDWREATE
ncbi:MAG: M48 family metalloprotease, partial [Blastocatellia bacterium]|nr:M48 family metalloprotease [Blastocatellia bacterium]